MTAALQTLLGEIGTFSARTMPDRGARAPLPSGVEPGTAAVLAVPVLAEPKPELGAAGIRLHLRHPHL